MITPMTAGTATSYHPKLFIVSVILMNVRTPDTKHSNTSHVTRQGSNTKFDTILQQLSSLLSTVMWSSTPKNSSGILYSEMCVSVRVLSLGSHLFTVSISTRTVAISFFGPVHITART